MLLALRHAVQANADLESQWVSAIVTTAQKYLFLSVTSKCLVAEGAGDGSVERGSEAERQALAVTSAALWLFGGGFPLMTSGSKVKVCRPLSAAL